MNFSPWSLLSLCVEGATAIIIIITNIICSGDPGRLKDDLSFDFQVQITRKTLPTIITMGKRRPFFVSCTITKLFWSIYSISKVIWRQSILYTFWEITQIYNNKQATNWKSKLNATTLTLNSLWAIRVTCVCWTLQHSCKTSWLSLNIKKRSFPIWANNTEEKRNRTMTLKNYCSSQIES